MVIGEINEIQATIAAAVEEQAATTAEISRSVHDAATGAVDIAGNIGSVAEASQGTSAGAASTLPAASDLASMADELRSLVGRFIVAGAIAPVHPPTSTAASSPARAHTPHPPEA